MASPSHALQTLQLHYSTTVFHGDKETVEPGVSLLTVGSICNLIWYSGAVFMKWKAPGIVVMVQLAIVASPVIWRANNTGWNSPFPSKIFARIDFCRFKVDKSVDPVVFYWHRASVRKIPSGLFYLVYYWIAGLKVCHWFLRPPHNSIFSMFVWFLHS